MARFALLCSLLNSFPAIAAEDPALEQYLSRLGLTELRLTYLERSLERESTSAKRSQLARKLADAYAEELAAAADEPERFAKLKGRAEKLLERFPDARSPAVQAALLQAEYQQAEALVIFGNSATDRLGHWWNRRPVALTATDSAEVRSDIAAPSAIAIGVFAGGSVVLPDRTALFIAGSVPGTTGKSRCVG